jgi:hypothetical protein
MSDTNEALHDLCRRWLYNLAVENDYDWLCVTGRDVIAQAQSGTGKTATFSIAILQQIDVQEKDCQALVLAPTRELAQQVRPWGNPPSSWWTAFPYLDCNIVYFLYSIVSNIPSFDMNFFLSKSRL